MVKSKKVSPPKVKGRRGKKVCPDCDALVPIHSQKCQQCSFQFKLNHKPRKVKQVLLGDRAFVFEKSTLWGGCSIIISSCKYYGISKQSCEGADKFMQL